MPWLMFRALQQPWQYGSFEILIRGFQKDKTQPCISRGAKVTSCQILKFLLQTWTSFNFDASWGTRSCFTFLETSNQYLNGTRLSWVLQCSKRLPGHAEKFYTRLKINAQNCSSTKDVFHYGVSFVEMYTPDDSPIFKRLAKQKD